jgi:hypothetical protein
MVAASAKTASAARRRTPRWRGIGRESVIVRLSAS